MAYHNNKRTNWNKNKMMVLPLHKGPNHSCKCSLTLTKVRTKESNLGSQKYFNTEIIKAIVQKKKNNEEEDNREKTILH